MVVSQPGREGHLDSNFVSTRQLTFSGTYKFLPLVTFVHYMYQSILASTVGSGVEEASAALEVIREHSSERLTLIRFS